MDNRLNAELADQWNRQHGPSLLAVHLQRRQKPYVARRCSNWTALVEPRAVCIFEWHLHRLRTSRGTAVDEEPHVGRRRVHGFVECCVGSNSNSGSSSSTDERDGCNCPVTG